MVRNDGAARRVRRRRAAGAVAALAAVVAILTVAFFRLQVLRSGEYALRSEENRLRAIPIPAPRGTIYDRDGRVIAENVPGYVISILPGRTDTVRAALDRLFNTIADISRLQG